MIENEKCFPGKIESRPAEMLVRGFRVKCVSMVEK